MLEKIILYVVSYFCVGTEIRFNVQRSEKDKIDSEFYFKLWSAEKWHGKSVESACLFLPEECPLVDHIINSYRKHYMGKQSLLSQVERPVMEKNIKRSKSPKPVSIPLSNQTSDTTKPPFTNKTVAALTMQ